MVLLTLSQKANQWLGPFLLRHGIKLRFALSGGVIRDNTWLDAALLLPLAQRLISLEVHEETQNLLRRGGKAGSFWNDLLQSSYYATTTSNSNNSSSNNNNNNKTTLSLEEESKLRLQVLEKYLRPALVPDETWSNIRRWQFHSRLIKWARKEYLLAQHLPRLRTALDAFRALRESPQIVKSRPAKRNNQNLFNNDDDHNGNDSTRIRRPLPPSTMILKAFAMEDWATNKNVVSSATHDDMRRIAEHLGGQVISLRGGGLCFAHIPGDAVVKDLSLQDILQVAGGFVSLCGPFNALCEQADIYQLWSKEYIELLGDYLMERVNAYEGETIVLDVGAGDGLLIQALRQHFETSAEKRPPVRPTTLSQRRRRSASIRNARPNKMPLFVATDDGSWSISQKALVENLSVEEAMEMYANEPNRQVIVLCSWMPMEQDWSYHFRKMNVDEYILIGEYEDGQCGDNWLTWGNHNYVGDVDDELELALSSSNSESSAETTNKDNELVTETTLLPPYSVDGYQRQDLNNLLPYQFSRFDCKVSKSAKTVSFRRINKPQPPPPAEAAP